MGIVPINTIFDGNNVFFNNGPLEKFLLTRMSLSVQCSKKQTSE